MSAAELYSFLLYFLQIFKQDIVPALYDFAIFIDKHHPIVCKPPIETNEQAAMHAS